ncbi:MAG TPA: hypothetical protein VIG32_09885 [Candidatus Baltobacteraceae bacterium]|jgi:hypothetical protein
MPHHLVLVVALIVAGVPAPIPSSAPHPAATEQPVLKVIGNVRASAACAEIATHANSAITTALRDDFVVSQTVAELRDVNLDDGNVIHRQNGLRALGDLAKTLMEQSRSGDREVQRLRGLATKSNDPTQKKELKSFADVLGGALWRQQTIARDLNGFLAATDAHDMVTFDESQQQANMGIYGVPDPTRAISPGEIHRGNALDNTVVPVLSIKNPNFRATDQARAAAADFESRIPDISNDEALAADHITGAVTGC